MSEIEIDFKPKVFDDPEYCESHDGECVHLSGANDCCSLFGGCDIGNMDDPDDFPKKHKECKAWFNDAIKFRERTIKKVCPKCGSNHLAFSAAGDKARCIYCGWKGTVDELKQKGA